MLKLFEYQNYITNIRRNPKLKQVIQPLWKLERQKGLVLVMTQQKHYSVPVMELHTKVSVDFNVPKQGFLVRLIKKTLH